MLFTPIISFINLKSAQPSERSCVIFVQSEITGIEDGSPHLKLVEYNDECNDEGSDRLLSALCT